MADGKNETIVDRVVQRLRMQPLGDLITEEDLHDAVKEALTRVFREKAKVRNPTYNPHGWGENLREFIEGREIIVECLADVLREPAKQVVQTWFETEGQAALAEHWKTLLETDVIAFVEKWRSDQVANSVRKVLGDAFHNENQQRQQRGLPPIVF